MRLASKFLLVLTTGAVVLLAAFALTSNRQDQSMLDSILERDAVLLGTGMSGMLAEIWKTQGQERALEMIAEVNQASPQLAVRWVWFDARGEDRSAPRVESRELANVRQHGTLTFVKTDEDGDRMQHMYIRVNVPGERIGGLEISERISRLDDALNRLINQVVVFGGAAVLVGGALVVLLGNHWVAGPLRLLIDKTRQIGRGDLSQPLAFRRRDEFGELADALDTMCQQLAYARRQVELEHAERINTLEQLRHEDRLRTVGRLASGIAHELGTPLNVVSGRAGLIASGRLSAEETRTSAVAIKAEAERMTKIIRQLLDFARRSTPQKTPSDLAAVARHTIELLTPLAQKSGCQLIMNADDEAHVPADANQIQQVLTNLIVNAIQAMPTGGHVTIALNRELAPDAAGELDKTREYLRIDVLDDGPGIPPEHLGHLFEPFFTTKQIGEGTGLGLSIAFSIVKEHGGWIAVQSEVGRGSCFSVFLPAEEPSCVAVS